MNQDKQPEAMRDALLMLIEAIEYTPLGLRQIKALTQARAALSDPQAQNVQDAKRMDWMDNHGRVHIDWTTAPSWARYAAMDDDGTWHWHENEPQQWHDMWWVARTGRRDQIPVDLDWKTTLMELNA